MHKNTPNVNGTPPHKSNHRQKYFWLRLWPVFAILHPMTFLSLHFLIYF